MVANTPLPVSTGQFNPSILTDLRSRDTTVRRKAMQELSDFISSQKNDTYSSNERVINHLKQELSDLPNSPEAADKLAGAAALEITIPLFVDEDSTTLTRYNYTLQKLLQVNDVLVAEHAVRATVNLITISGSLGPSLLESVITNALEWLQGDRLDTRRHAAVLLIKELALAIPNSVYSYVNQASEALWGPLRDSKPAVRQAASEALGATLDIIESRETPFRLPHLTGLYDEAQKGVKMGTLESLHSSLLVFQQLLQHSGMFMSDHYREVALLVAKVKDHREFLIRQSAVLLMEILAEYSPSDYRRPMNPNAPDETPVSLFVPYLIGLLKKDKERALAYTALGKIALTMRHDFKPFVQATMHQIKDALASKAKYRVHPDVETAILICVRHLAVALGPVLAKHLHDSLDLLFLSGLNPSLTAALDSISKNVNQLLPAVQSRLLDELSIILAGQRFIPPGSLAAVLVHPISASTSSVPAGAHEPKDASLLILALQTLGGFNFQPHNLTELVRDHILHYLDHDVPEVRIAAAVAINQVFDKDKICQQTSYHAAEIVNETLQHLLSVAIADSNAAVRIRTLRALTPNFDHQLSQADNIRMFSLTLNDEVIEIKQLAIAILGRLIGRNPAQVLPFLRRSLMQVLTELECTLSNRAKEECCHIVYQLALSAQQWVRAYVVPIYKVLFPTIKDSHTGVSVAALRAVSEITRAGGEDLMDFLSDLLPAIIDILQDQVSAQRRLYALKTLGNLGTYAGVVIAPYTEFPQLMGIMIGFLRNEKDRDIRRETFRVMGVLGAIDPYHYKNAFQAGHTLHGDGEALLPMSPLLQEDYDLNVVISCLVRILSDVNLALHHSSAIQAIMHLFTTMGSRCFRFLPKLIPAFTQEMKVCAPSVLDFYFEQLSNLIVICRLNIQDYVRDVLQLVNQHWSAGPNIQQTIIGVIESLSLALDGDFREHLPEVLPRMLEALDADTTERRTLSGKVLHAIATFGTNVEEYIHFILPVFIRVLERVDFATAIKQKTLYTICVIAQAVSCRSFASRLVHCILRLLTSHAPNNQHRELQSAAMDTLCVLLCQLQLDYLPFVSAVDKVMLRQKIHHAKYDALLTKLIHNGPLPRQFAVPNFDQLVRKLPPESVALDAGPEAAKMHINQAVLRERCNTRPWSTREDWLNWIHRFSLVLLEESPSPALRACSSLAAQFPPLAKDLFNVGFVTIWTESPEPDQDLLVQAMRNALTTKDVPNEILQTVLNLAEFMEHSEKAIQIDIRTLAAFAMNCNAYAKALHYSELTFSTAATADNLNTLIKAYTTLNQQDAAAGLVKYTTQMLPEIPLNYGWYERLNRWEEALAFYKRQDPELANDTHMVVSKMRCLHALCEWDQLATMIDEWWDRLSDPNRHTVALLAAGAAWGSGDLDKIDQYLNFIDKNSSDQYFFKAVLAVNRGQDNAREMIQRTRDLLDNEITSLSEGYGRAYSSIVRVQMLSEFEEILDYKSYAEQPKRQEIIRETWNKRLKGVSREVDVWQKILRVRSSVLPPNEDMDVWLQFADLCRSSGHLSFAEQTIASIIKKEPLELKADVIRMAPSEVVYAYLEVLWARNEHRPAVYEFLETYTSHIRYQFGLEQRQGEMHVPHHAEEFEYQLPDKDVDVSAILSRFHLKKGEWYAELHEERDEAFFQHVLKCYQVATTMAPHWYTAWHAWAQTNYEVITTAERQHQPVTPEMLVTYIIPAVQGFFKSIALSDGSTLQETLRLLSLLFNYGHQQDVCMALSHGLQDVPLNTWLQVVPQLIARIHARSPNVRQLIQHILGILGKEFPQALLFSLIVATKSENPTRQKIATDIMEKMKLHDPNLVNEAQLVGQELIRAALLWAEMWESAVAEASRQYYNHHNIPAMYEVLKQHHQLIQKGPTTIKETQFVQTFGRDLREAWDQIQQYRQTLDVNLLGQAWDIYIHLFKKFEKLTPKATTLSLEQVAPNLLACHDLELCLPGYFDPNKPLVRIQRFEPTMSVFPTKQKPRRIMIHGSDGVSYLYLLKGNEDLRQDERVMQLFELVNSLLFQDTETFKRHLDIERYPVVPLSPNTGLIGWVNDSDTFHTLIKEFRDMRKTTLGIEHRIMTAIAPNYDHMPLLPKVEVFEATLNQTHGQDLYKVLWLKSPNSEVWLERRTCYTRSLAVMSIVGYILGLGDRHPSNLMLHRKTGKVVHIDFGDCFEVSMHRDRFPENVPFRLTRMLILAMEMCGIEGTFRITCEHVMRVLRENKDSLMAVLEAFIYDPLINWRLTSVRTSSIFVDGDMMPRRGQQSEEGFAMRDESAQVNAEQQNPRAIEAINRISNKLTGRDFNPSQVLPINVQVDRLIRQATSSENLSPLYIGWCPFW